MMNRFFTLLLAASCLTAVGQVPDYVPTDGLLAWYGMDGDTEDELGEFNGVPSGLEQSIDRFGNAASCFHFSGGDSHIDLGVDGALVPATALTFAVWMKPIWNADFSQNTIVGRNTNSSSNYGVNWGIYGSPDDRILRFGIGDAQNFGVVDDMDVPYPIEEEVWVHYAVTYDASNDSVKFFIDGQVVAVELTEVDEINDNGQNTFIGKYRANGGGCTCQWFTGDLDELGIWNRTLSYEELWFLYQLSKPIEGCTDFNACNFSEEANVDDESCLPSGCMDTQACNFSAEAVCDDGSCDYSCCPGPGCCDVGTEWSWESNTCIVTNPSDSNFDGCVQLNDLLDLLSAYGDCGAEEEASGFALSFDGVNDHVDFGNASLGNVEDVTFEVLMKTGSDSEGLGSNYQALLSKDCNGCEFSTGDWAILIGHNGNGVASFTINNSSGVAAVESGFLNDEEWHWISVTRNATTGLVHLYVDGVEVDSDIGPVGLVHNEEKMYLAKYFLTSPSHYEGLIGEFRVWNWELTDIEIGTYLELNYRAMKVAWSDCGISLKERVMC